MKIKEIDIRYVAVKKGEEREVITNFCFKIKKDTVYAYPGKNCEHFYTIIGVNSNGEKLNEIKVSACEYEKMTWESQWGTKEIVLNKSVFRNQIRIMGLKDGSIEHETKYMYLGYIGTDETSKEVCYVDNGGLISRDIYDPTIKSELYGKLANYSLPKPIKNTKKLKQCIRKVLNLRNIAPANHDIKILIMANPIRPLISVFLPVTCSHFIVGETGARKSALAALIQSFHGPKFSHQTQLPAEWEDTENALEEMTIMIRNASLVVDEYTATTSNEKKLSDKAERVFRGSANQSSRKRSNTDGSLQNKANPAAMVLATGESVPKLVTESLLRRIIFFSVNKDDIDPTRLTEAQALARDGVLAEFSSSLIQCLLQRYDCLKNKLPVIFDDYRQRAANELPKEIHPRQCENIASLMVSIEVLFWFANRHNAITVEKKGKLLRIYWNKLKQLAIKQTSITKDASMPGLFFKYLKQGLENGKIYLKDYETGDTPNIKEAAKVGWIEGKSQGQCVGWYDKKTDRFFIKSSVEIFQVLRNLIPEGFQHLVPQEEKDFWKKIKQSGGLSVTGRERNKVRKTEPVTKKEVLVYVLALGLNT